MEKFETYIQFFLDVQQFMMYYNLRKFALISSRSTPN